MRKREERKKLVRGQFGVRGVHKHTEKIEREKKLENIERERVRTQVE